MKNFKAIVYKDNTWSFHILCDTGFKWDELKDIVGVDAMLASTKYIRSYYTDPVQVTAKDREQTEMLMNKYVTKSK